MPPHELNHLAAWFHHLSRRKDPAYLRELDAAFDSIDGGEGVSLEDYKRLSEELGKSGL